VCSCKLFLGVLPVLHRLPVGCCSSLILQVLFCQSQQLTLVARAWPSRSCSLPAIKSSKVIYNTQHLALLLPDPHGNRQQAHLDGSPVAAAAPCRWLGSIARCSRHLLLQFTSAAAASLLLSRFPDGVLPNPFQHFPTAAHGWASNRAQIGQLLIVHVPESQQHLRGWPSDDADTVSMPSSRWRYLPVHPSPKLPPSCRW